MRGPTTNLPVPPDLPDTTDKFKALRNLKIERTLNDQVEDLMLGLVEDEKFRRFLHACYDAQAIEGSLAADNLEAAHLIRERAKRVGYPEVAQEKKAVIAKALGIVLRRYDLDRKSRKNTVSGAKVAETTENG